MVKIQEIPLFLLMLFTLVYATAGNSDNDYWSGAYFIVNYITMFSLFYGHKSKLIRLIGISLSFSCILFNIGKYILHLNVEKYFIIITFTICVIGILKLDRRR